MLLAKFAQSLAVMLLKYEVFSYKINLKILFLRLIVVKVLGANPASSSLLLPSWQSH